MLAPDFYKNIKAMLGTGVLNFLFNDNEDPFLEKGGEDFKAGLFESFI